MKWIKGDTEAARQIILNEVHPALKNWFLWSGTLTAPLPLSGKGRSPYHDNLTVFFFATLAVFVCCFGPGSVHRLPHTTKLLTKTVEGQGCCF